jgi:hypothetical protein
MNTQVKVRPYTKKADVLNTLKLNPNSTTKELSLIMPHMDIDSISHAISSMADKGIVFTTGKKVETGPSGRDITHRAYSVKYEKPNKAPPLRAQPNVQPDLFADLINTMEAEIATLTMWKEAAILRYPDLDVDPILLKARDILAAQLEEDGKTVRIQDVLNGSMDNSSALRALVKLLKEIK